MAFGVGEAASCSSLPSATAPRSYTYHVFLSFRGADTRKGFLDHLHASLERKGITTFKDDKRLEKGQVIADEIVKAIEESMFAIIVLSPNYAASSWCLDELQMIVECNNNLGVSVVPVFYGVDPSDVRYQKGSFEEAFRKHLERFGEDNDKLKRWRDALTQVANLSGWNSKNEHEAALVENIAQDIHKRLIPKLPSCTKNLVGIDSKVKEVCSLLGMGLNDVRFIGIWGMGGVGKTTIARAVYEAIQDEFKVSCFLANVREVCETKGLVQMQKELVAHMNISMTYVNNVYDGKKMIRNSLCNKKVLLILDDVSEVSHLENLAGERDWFGPGSRIIITTRDMHLLKIHGVHGSYEVEGLIKNEALQLFCLKAFKRDQPEEGYLEMSHEVVNYTCGLPLALEVLGSYLCGRNVDVWHSAVKKIKSDSHGQILDTLKISYDSLDSKQKNIFLDIACFFKGHDINNVMDILENCGYNPRIEIEVLIERSLVTLSGEHFLKMHDLIEEMGRNIVIQESPDDPGKRSRLWSTEDINLVLTNNKGTASIQSIFPLRIFFYKGCWSEIFSNMSQLKLLKISWLEVRLFQRDMELPLDLNYLPSSLKVLHWDCCPFKTLPLADRQNEIVEIKLQLGKIEQLWHGIKFLGKLKCLDLSVCKELKQIPDLSAVPILEKLKLSTCDGLIEVHPSLIHHKNLVVLDLRGCKQLKSFPGKLEMSSLKELILDDCQCLENLPEFGECMKHLSVLSLGRTAIRKLPASMRYLVGLKDLNLKKCEKLVCLRDAVDGLKLLRVLTVSDCRNLVCLPDSIHGLESLAILNASGCGYLDRLPSSISHLPSLCDLNLSNCHLTEQALPLDFRHFPSLESLHLSGNKFFTLPMSIHKLTMLKYLHLSKCANLLSLPELPSSMRLLEAYGCDSLNVSEFSPLSKACRFFASPRKDHGAQALQMLISGKEIPPWFVHQEVGNSVLVPLQDNFALDQSLGIAFCFRLQLGRFCHLHNKSLVVHNGKRLIATEIPYIESGDQLYILCLSRHCFGDEVHQDNLFELSFEKSIFLPFKIASSAARWICKQDIEDLNTIKTG